MSTDEDYYKPSITNDAFNSNYIQDGSKGNKDKVLTPSEYLDMIRPYLSDIINDHKSQVTTEHKAQSEWKIQVTIAINFISSKDSDETHTMHAKSDNVEIMMGSETNEIIE